MIAKLLIIPYLLLPSFTMQDSVGLDEPPHRRAGRQQVLLADHLVERSGP
jgi:hypothetical protein